MATLTERLLKTSTLDFTANLNQSKIYGKKDMIPTMVPMLNVALSGRLDGGLVPGHTMIAGPSKHFKTAFMLLLAASYLNKYEDAIVLFYDSEFGAPEQYFRSFGIDPARVIHTPVTDINELKEDITNQIEGLDRKDKVLIMIDSIGNLASKKEKEDALKGSEAADMTRAKQMKSLFRIITPKLTVKDIPLVTINHTYKTQEMYSKDVVSGGTGATYSADNIWIIGREQEKDEKTKQITGWDFKIRVEKSRFVKEKAVIAINVSYENGISRWSGLFDNAKDAGFIVQNGQGFYALVNTDTGEYDEKQKLRRADIEDDKEFWLTMLKNEKFKKYIEETYMLPNSDLLETEG